MIGCLAAKIVKSIERTTKFQFLKMTMTTNFDEETHKYTIDGIEYPSVTEICEPISFKRLDALSKSLLDRAKQRGTEVHELCETYALTGEVDDEMKEKGEEIVSESLGDDMIQITPFPSTHGLAYIISFVEEICVSGEAESILESRIRDLLDNYP